MTQFIAAISLVVPDYDQAVSFYVGLLGFDLIEDTQIDEDSRRVLVAPPGSTETRIMIEKAASQEQEDAIGNQTGGRIAFTLETYDFETDAAMMEQAGIDVIEEERQGPEGTTLIFRDPFGNKWKLIERH